MSPWLFPLRVTLLCLQYHLMVPCSQHPYIYPNSLLSHLMDSSSYTDSLHGLIFIYGCAYGVILQSFLCLLFVLTTNLYHRLMITLLPYNINELLCFHLFCWELCFDGSCNTYGAAWVAECSLVPALILLSWLLNILFYTFGRSRIWLGQFHGKLAKLIRLRIRTNQVKFSRRPYLI